DLVKESRQRKTKIKTLEEQNDQLKQQLEKSKNEIESQRKHREASEKKATNAEKRLQEMEREPANPFGLALIDGDGYIFEEDLLREGSTGGAIAAQRLLEQIQGYFQKLDRSAHQWRTVVRIFVNLEGLAKKCNLSGIVDHTAVFREFTTAFTKAQPLFDIVDVGYGKEQADHKIRERRSSHIPPPAIPLGDTELPLNNNAKSPALKSAQLQRRMSAGNNGHMRRPSTPGAGPAPMAEMQPQQVVPPEAHGVVRPRTPAVEPYNETFNPFRVTRNRNGERVNTPLPKVNREHHETFKQKFLNNSQQPCNSMVSGDPCQTLDCKYSHEQLTPFHMIIQAGRIRSSPCVQVSACSDPKCLYGHTCPHDPYCGHGPNCKLVKFHGKDKEACEDIQEDSERAKRQKFSHDY
ncbi:MAG: hypothetical protein Q9191_008178, partial [Dirinaria sp. TL-2023a]